MKTNNLSSAKDFIFNINKFPEHYQLAINSIEKYRACNCVKDAFLACGSNKQLEVDYINFFHHNWQNSRDFYNQRENEVRFHEYKKEGYTIIDINLHNELMSHREAINHKVWMKEIIPLLHKANSLGIKVISTLHHIGENETSQILSKEKIYTNRKDLLKFPKFGHPGMVIHASFRYEWWLESLASWVEYFELKTKF